ncbi:hypothetical protein EYF80_025502 [Liparis tanakae]|uniref:Uncharacterized protein n=1 Tax=Liparis tanakae TaxID=230148 RepID=A0A4Z2HF64_9TELE|nr:hypothetical protein EYF80_025502 [Liparis tanakae]
MWSSRVEEESVRTERQKLRDAEEEEEEEEEKEVGNKTKRLFGISRILRFYVRFPLAPISGTQRCRGKRALAGSDAGEAV